MGISDFAIRSKVLHVLHRIRKVASENHSPRWIIFFVDLLFPTIAVPLGFLIRFNFKIDLINGSDILEALLLIVIVRILIAYFFKIYAHVIRYTSFYDLRRLFIATLTGTLLILSTVLFERKINNNLQLPLSIIVMEFFFTLYFMVNFRLVIRYVYILLNNIDLDSHATIIIGSKDLAVLIKDALEINPKKNYKTIAFVDSKITRKKKKLAGLSIYKFDDLQYLIEKYHVTKLVIAKPDISDLEKEYIGKLIHQYKIKMLSAPDLWNIPTSGNVGIEEINMEQLLDRKPINLEKDHIIKELTGKNILITGAAGSIGSELARQIITYKPKNLILIDQAETPLYDIELELKESYGSENITVVLSNINNKNRIEKVFKHFRPQIVYHAAAYKHVPMMENNPMEAFTNNVLGSRNLADISDQFGVEKFVMVSTDKAVNPTGIMGATKRMAEMYIQSLNDQSNTNYITTRFGNVLNSNGSVIPRFLKQIREGGPVTVTHPEITRYFMTIPEACQLVLEASVIGNGGEIFLFDMGNAVKILELAKNLIRSTGYIVGRDIEIKFTGLRPGEKLYEELLLEAEANLPTHHPKIKIAEVCKYDFNTIKQQLDMFAFPIESQNVTEVVRLMKEMVPTYKSKNSVFEKLDQAV